MSEIDSLRINFSTSSLFLLNVILAFIMFGIALDLRWANFKSVLAHPRGLIIGLSSQLILLPFLTYLLILIIKPLPSMALGMILVASCPGGNISNFISTVAKANVELSIVMTVVTSVSAILFTPFNLTLYGMMYEPTREIMVKVHLDWIQIIQTIALIIIFPIFLGKLFSYWKPFWSEKIKKPFRNLSMLAFLVIVIFALLSNGHYFYEFISVVFFLVLFHNGLAFLAAFGWAKLFRLDKASVKSITIETGIQNSGLGLLLIFTFFSGLGGMTLVAAWWGIWHIISGFSLAAIFKWKKY